MPAIPRASAAHACRFALAVLAGLLSPAAESIAGSGIELQVTVGTDLAPAACGTATSLEVVYGDEVNFCYRVTNRTAATLGYQTLSDGTDGVVLASGTPRAIAPGETYQYLSLIHI